MQRIAYCVIRMDATLRELTQLITEVYPNTKIKGTEFQFSTVYPFKGQFRMRDIGTTTIGRKGPDDNSTLKSKKFVIGDYIDVAINVHRESGRGGGGGSGGGGGGPDRDHRDRDRDRGRDSRRSPYDRRRGGGGGGGGGGGHDYR